MPAKKKAATKSLSKGDHVTWNTSQGETHGVIQKKLTTPTKIKEHKVSASPDNPEYLVKSSKSGDLAAHKPESLHKTRAAKKGVASKPATKKASTKKTAAKTASAKKSSSRKSAVKKSAARKSKS